MRCKNCGSEFNLIITCSKCYAEKRNKIKKIIYKNVCSLCKVKLYFSEWEIKEIEKEGDKIDGL